MTDFPHMIPPIISIVGRSGSGKTTLIEKLVQELKHRGYRVGTIKHDAHHFKIDYPGKDSYRHFHAGADTTVIVSSEKMAMVHRLSEMPSLDTLTEWLFPDVHIVLTEGFRRSDKPKIEVFRAAVADTSLCTENDNRIAFVTDDPLSVDVPKFGLNDVQGIVNFIVVTVLHVIPNTSPIS